MTPAAPSPATQPRRRRAAGPPAPARAARAVPRPVPEGMTA
jgi:hypothetical protein